MKIPIALAIHIRNVIAGVVFFFKIIADADVLQ
jgi:hypothetical protein